VTTLASDEIADLVRRLQDMSEHSGYRRLSREAADALEHLAHELAVQRRAKHLPAEKYQKDEKQKITAENKSTCADISDIDSKREPDQH
jgi:hypothetical protein